MVTLKEALKLVRIEKETDQVLIVTREEKSIVKVNERGHKQTFREPERSEYFTLKGLRNKFDFKNTYVKYIDMDVYTDYDSDSCEIMGYKFILKTT